MQSITLPTGAKATYNFLTQFPDWTNFLDNYPTQKTLTYRQEYDGVTVANTPCNTGEQNCTTEIWQYAISNVGGYGDGLITAPDGGETRDFSLGGLSYTTIRSDGTVIERNWKNNFNPFVKTEFVSIPNAAGTLVKTAIKDYNYDRNGNVTRVAEYDWVPYASVHNSGSPVWSLTGLTPARVTTTSYYNGTPDALDTTTPNDPDSYYNATAPRLLQLVASSEVNNGSQTLARSEFSYDNTLTTGTTGNLTEQKSWDSTKGPLNSSPPILTPSNSVSILTQYNQYGSPILTTDARGNQTLLVYGAVGGFTDLYPTEVRTAYQTAVQRTQTSEYDFSTGLVTRVTDVDNGVSSSTAYDLFGRPILVKAAEGKPEETHTSIAYSDTARRVITRSDLSGLGDGKLVSIQHYDQMGRARLARQLEDSATQDPTNETHGIKVQTRYKYSGANSYQVSSHPYREAFSSEVPAGAMDWTRAKADNGGRMLETRKYGGNTLPEPWGSNTTGTGGVVTTYDANFVTVTDQAGKLRRSVTDGLGRLERVDEPDDNNNLDVNGVPFQSTSYSYDALDNLTTVTQGAQTRTFTYNSLSRLRSAANPESGTISYTYDDNGNLLTKTDARLVVSTYGYDALNRNTGVTYTNDPANTPGVIRMYDQATNGKGRLWLTQTSVAANSVTAIESYDAHGRPLIQHQEFYYDAGGHLAFKSYTTQRSYDLAGNVKTQTYPSGHTVTYDYDSAGRMSSFTGNLGEGVPRTYANEFQYTESGGVQQEKFGTDTPLYHKQGFNERGQLWDMRLSTVPFATDPANGDRGAIVNYYSNNFVQGGTGADNNGNLLRQEIYIPGSSFFQQDFAYDSLNRLQLISEKLNGNDTFKQAYTFDRWGNRTIDQANTTTNVPHPEYTVDPNNNNRLLAPTGYTHEYDAAGNQTRDTYTTNNPSGGQRTYDAENRIIAAQKFPSGKGGTTWAYYTYNGDGQRVRRKVSGTETWQVYGFDGELLAEYPQTGPSLAVAQPQKEYGYRNGQLLVTTEPWVNAAWSKPATQTDDLNENTTAAKAANGDTDGTLADGSVAATNSHANSWWQVDLQSVQTISSITVWGRTDCCPEMTTDFYVFVSDNPFTSTDLNTTLAQPGVSNRRYLEYADPASLEFNRTGRYVRVQLAGTQSLALAEVQVWSAAAKVNWLVSDHLGTPRMIVDKTGSLAGVSRHDYLPFGEELFAGTGGRTTTMGYSATDGVRQKFTLKERDNETGLDYFGARYYSGAQGRFTSVDPFNPILSKQASADRSAGEHELIIWILEPQRWNKYTYALNNPLKYLDPDGEDPQDALQVLQKAVQRLGGFRGLAKGLVSKGNVAATATQLALETLLGNTIAFAPTGLNSSEIELAKEVSAFEGRSFLGAGNAAPGIDGFLHDGQSPINNPQPIQLQENSTGGDYRIFDDATRHENQASKAGYKNVDLYVKSTDKSVTVGSVLNFIQKGGSGGLVGVTNRGTFKSVTILTQDGAVRIDRGKVTSCDNNGRCQAQ